MQARGTRKRNAKARGSLAVTKQFEKGLRRKVSFGDQFENKYIYNKMHKL